MPSAEIITIGTEILLGEIVDTNAQYLARKFRDAGIDLFHKSTVGDNADRIAQVIRHAMESSDIIITTGGLGPTVDDPTREAIAMAVGVELEYRPELWEQITARFQRYDREPTENNKRQAFVPKGAVPVENPVGTAPAFIVEHTISSSPQGSALPSGSKSSHGSTEAPSRTIIALPGVPREMEYLLEKEVLPYLRTRYQLSGIIKTRLIHTVGVGESQIDDLIGDLETLSNPTVGLAAHSGQVDVRITAKAGSEAQANELIRGIETTLVERLNTWIYGADQETLEDVALKALKRREWTLATVEFGLNGNLIRRLSIASQKWEKGGSPFRGGEVITKPPSLEELSTFTSNCRQNRQVDVGLGVAIYLGAEKHDVSIVLITPTGRQEFVRPFGGPPEYAPLWALHHCLDVVRKL